MKVLMKKQKTLELRQYVLFMAALLRVLSSINTPFIDRTFYFKEPRNKKEIPVINRQLKEFLSWGKR
jgi:hypothetical protein